MALGCIPIVGPLVGGIWNLVCTIMGIKEAHEISTLKAAVAVLLPGLVVFVLALVIAAFLVSTMGLKMLN
jgi:hypothetical protein